jgi:hypothetical protein
LDKKRTLEDDLKAFAGLGPGGQLNFGYADGYFWEHMKKTYKRTDAQLKAELERVKRG